MEYDITRVPHILPYFNETVYNQVSGCGSILILLVPFHQSC